MYTYTAQHRHGCQAHARSRSLPADVPPGLADRGCQAQAHRPRAGARLAGRIIAGAVPGLQDVVSDPARLCERSIVPGVDRAGYKTMQDVGESIPRPSVAGRPLQTFTSVWGGELEL